MDAFYRSRRQFLRLPFVIEEQKRKPSRHAPEFMPRSGLPVLMAAPKPQLFVAFIYAPPQQSSCSRKLYGYSSFSSARSLASRYKTTLCPWKKIVGGRTLSKVSGISTISFIVQRGTYPSERTKMTSADIAPTKPIDIASVGNMCIDIMLPISNYPISHGEHQRLRNGAFFEIGGSLNALISASRLKTKTAAIAYISGKRDDLHPSDILLSQYLVSAAQGEGIDVQGLIPHSRGTVPTCAALFDPSGSHTFLASNEEIQTQELHIQCLPQVMEDLVRKSKALLIDGYALHSDRELVRQCLDVARQNKCEIWVDPQAATASLLRRKDDLFLTILNSAQGISLNLHEAKTLTGKEELDDIVRALPFFSSAQTILLKDGPYGCHAFAKTTVGDETCSAPGFDLGDTYRDSIGAGDAFIGAFLAGKLVHGLKLRDCCILANAMAAATCMQHGAGVSGIGSNAQVEQMISQSSLGQEHDVLKTLRR